MNPGRKLVAHIPHPLLGGVQVLVRLGRADFGPALNMLFAFIQAVANNPGFS